MKCDNLAEKEQQLCDVIERLEGEKEELIKKQNELVMERDNLLTRCEEFTQTIYEYDVEKITMAGKMEEMQNKLEVYCLFHQINRYLARNISPSFLLPSAFFHCLITKNVFRNPNLSINFCQIFSTLNVERSLFRLCFGIL